TNENNLLTRFILNGDYSLGPVAQTSSPSMDIQVASNFERYLYYLNGEDAAMTRQDMDRFAASGSLQFDELAQERVRADFASRSVDEAETIDIIRDFYTLHGYVLDPHTAVGVKAGLAGREEGVPMICLATAHPAKFGAAVRRAIGHEPDLPSSLAALTDKETRCEVMAAEIEAVQSFVEQHAL
ncbi:MAG: threonine synthase, partial [Proteobacteria bacterium]|nr:threonine synthase [Pseudomonadota bacterium]